MLVKFFDTGKGSARSAFQYLLNKERVKNGTAVLLSGSPESITFLTEQRMKSPSYKGGALYTSGVLSFSENENVKDRDLSLIIDRFREAMFPRLDHSRFNMAFIKHLDKNRQEVHFVIQNFDLETKKTITPFVKDRDLSRINAFKNQVNLDFNLIDPNLSKVHFLVKRMKRLTDEQKAFYKELNTEYQKHLEKHENRTFMQEMNGVLSKEHNFIGLNEPQTGENKTNEDKFNFIQKFVTERFSHVKINRSSEDYISLDFGENKKMRLFYERAEVKELENATEIKVEQNKKAGLMPSYENHIKQISAELRERCLNEVSRLEQIQEEKRKRLEKEREEEERQRQLQLQEQRQREGRRLAEEEKPKQPSELELKAAAMIADALNYRDPLAALDDEQLKKLETQKSLLKEDLITAITGRYIFIRDKPKYYNSAVRKLDYIEEHFGSDIRRIVEKEFEKQFIEAYQGIMGKAPTFKMGM